MTDPRDDRDTTFREPPAHTPATPEEIAGNALTRRGSTRAVESLGLMPLLLGAAAVVVVALLLFGAESSPPFEQSGQPPATQN